MNSSYRSIIFTMYLCCLLLSTTVSAQNFTFQGRIITNTGQPASDAYLFANITPSNPKQPIITVRTDPNGFFKIHQPADSLTITNIRKKGYYFPKNKLKHTFDLASLQQTPIFKIYKQKSPARIQSRYTYVAWASNPSSYKIDLTQSGFPSSACKQKNTTKALTVFDKSKEKQKIRTDLKITTKIIRNKTGCLIKLETPDKDSGIIVSDQLLQKQKRSPIPANTFTSKPEKIKYTPGWHLVQNQMQITCC